jgi:soluble lytic murein transglycosylase-like protein
MTPAALLRLIAIALAGLLYAVPARASEALDAIRVLCPRHTAIAPLARAAAARHDVSPTLLVAVVAHESGCRWWARSGKGDVGLGQIRIGGSAAGKATVAELLDPARNLDLTAAHIARCLALCRGSSGLSVYAGNRRCRSTRYSRAVMAKVQTVRERTART